jgi:hypothetical protein
MQKNAIKFAHVKKKQYFCTRFAQKTLSERLKMRFG